MKKFTKITLTVLAIALVVIIVGGIILACMSTKDASNIDDVPKVEGTNKDDTNNGGETTNTGDTNTGDTNTGDTNTGDTNTGDTNTGDTNTGDTNTGDTNTGDTNTGDTNTGDINNGNTSEKEVDRYAWFNSVRRHKVYYKDGTFEVEDCTEHGCVCGRQEG